MSKTYIRVNDEMTWPHPNSSELHRIMEEVVAHAIYNETTVILTKQDAMTIRSVVSAYESLLCHPARNLEDTRKLVRDIRKAINEIS